MKGIGPFKKTCLSLGSIPVQPYWILGGFIPEGEVGFPENPEYNKATAIIIQIILDNYDSLSDDPDDVRGLERAMEWEETLINFLKEFSAVMHLGNPLIERY